MTTNASILSRRTAAVPRGIATAAPIFVDRAENGEIWDAEGQRYIDFASGIAVTNTGHRHPKVMAAVAEQCAKFTHLCFQVTGYENYVELAERLNRAAPIANAKSLFFTTGAEATENAVKIARAHTGRPGVITFTGAFHGRTQLTMAMTGKAVPYRPRGTPPSVGIYHVPFPIPHHGTTEEMALKALYHVFKADIAPDQVAAIVIEPVQGEGGFYQTPLAFMQELAAALRPARHLPGRRRGAVGLRPHRQDVRHRALRHRARPDPGRQGAGRRLPDLGRHRQGRGDGRRRARRPRRHLWRQPGRGRRRARGARRHRGGEALRALGSDRPDRWSTG